MTHVVHVITTINRGGAENQLLILAREQLRIGLKVTIIPLKGELDLLKEFTQVGATVNLEVVNKPLLKQFRILRKLLSSDLVVHAHLPRAEILSSISTNSNLVFSRHNSEPFFPSAPRFVSAILSRFVSYRAKSGIAISQAVRDFLYESREISQKLPLRVILYGIPLASDDRLATQEKVLIDFDKEAQPFVVGTIGRLVPQKDYPTLLRAFSLILENKPNAVLVILGDGVERESLNKLAQELSISKKIFWVGKTSNVYAYLSLMDVFVLSSIYEGFGLVLAEAMVSRVPIVASRNSAIPEVLGETHPGLAQTGNPHDFASKILLMADGIVRISALENQDSRLHLFDPAGMAREILEVYQS